MSEQEREKKFSRPKCPRCNSSSIVVRVDGSIFCRRCGCDTRDL